MNVLLEIDARCNRSIEAFPHPHQITRNPPFTVAEEEGRR